MSYMCLKMTWGKEGEDEEGTKELKLPIYRQRKEGTWPHPLSNSPTPYPNVPQANGTPRPWKQRMACNWDHVQLEKLVEPRKSSNWKISSMSSVMPRDLREGGGGLLLRSHPKAAWKYLLEMIKTLNSKPLMYQLLFILFVLKV